MKSSQITKEEKIPKGLRKGQTIFNFLEWLRLKGYGTNESSRMADPFYIEDEEWDKLYSKFLSEIKSSQDKGE